MHVLTVDRIKDKTKTLGPGVRTVVWFHGCPRHCPNCIAASMNESFDYSEFSPEELLNRVFSVDGVEGVTISGGEPFAQDLEALSKFLSEIHASGRSTMAFTGYLLEELKADDARRNLLHSIDILVDGPYEEREDHGELWRGSSNQRFHFLTDRYSNIEESIERQKGRPLEFDLNEDNSFSFAGIPPRGFRSKLEKRFRDRGLEVNWQNNVQSKFSAQGVKK